MDIDPLFVGAAAYNQIYFVATENVMQKGRLSKLLARYLNPIIHQKGRAGLRSTMEMLRTMKGGASVALFPEGNRTFNGLTWSIPFATAKLAKKSGVKLVTVRLEGGYLTQPRWGHGFRKGRVFCRLVNVYEPADLKAMSDDEVYQHMCDDLRENAFERQNEIAAAEGAPVSFKGKDPAYGLETALFMCPECGAMSALTSDSDSVRCTCGHKATYLPTGFFEGGRFQTMLEWDQWQHAELMKLLREGTEPTAEVAVADDAAAESAAGEAASEAEPSVRRLLFADQVTAKLIGENHEIAKSIAGEVRAYTDGFGFVPKSGEEVLFAYEDIVGVGLFLRNTLIAHVGKDALHYELNGAESFNALKYKYVYEGIGELRGAVAE